MSEPTVHASVIRSFLETWRTTSDGQNSLAALKLAKQIEDLLPADPFAALVAEDGWKRLGNGAVSWGREDPSTFKTYVTVGRQDGAWVVNLGEGGNGMTFVRSTAEAAVKWAITLREALEDE